MVRKAFSVAAIAAFAVAVAACGGKDKQEATTPEPEPVTSEPDDDSDSEPAVAEPTDTGDTGGDSGGDLTEVIYFEFDSSSLTDEARRQLQQNAEWLRADSSRQLTVEGHTDEVGTPEYNLALGERRAQAVMQYLVQLGISEDRVEIVTFGEERPAAQEHAENRRSVFVPLN